MADQPQRKLNLHMQVSEASFRIFQELANKSGGRDLMTYGSDLFEEAVTNRAEEMFSESVMPPAIALALYHYKLRARETVFAQLLDVARIALQGQDTAIADKLEDLCMANGVDKEELMVMAGASANIVPQSVFLYAEGATKEEQAKSFLYRLFAEKGVNVLQVTLVQALGEQQGLSKNALDLGRKRMGILSVRTGSTWAWQIPTLASFSPQLVDGKIIR